MAACSEKSSWQPWRAPVICVALAAVTFAVFGRTLGGGFVNFDDNLYVYDNPMVNHGFTGEGVVQALTRSHSANWHPLTWLSHMLDCQVYGLNPWGHHLTNVLLHAAVVIGLFWILSRMTGAFWKSAFVAAVFAVHPLRVESVAWVSERKDMLSGLFFMLTLGAYCRYARQPGSPARYGLVLLLFALGLMCKPMLVTLPLLLLALDYWPLQRKESAAKLILEKLPLLALSAAGCAVTLWAQQEGIHTGGAFSLAHRLENGLVSPVVYLGQMIRPVGLAALYPFPRNGNPPGEVIASVLILAGLSIFAWMQRKTQPWLLAGWVWYLVMLAPVLGIIQAGRQAHADRYTYLPQIGIYVAATWWAACWLRNRAVAAGLMIAVPVVLGVCAWKQAAYWQNSRALWGHTIACTADNAVAENNFGSALGQNGEGDAAISHYRRALQIRPDYAEAHSNLGFELYKKTRTEEAIAQYREAVRIWPDFAGAHFNLGAALRKKGDLAGAIVQYQETLRINSGLVAARNDLGTALRQSGRLDEAIVQYQLALQTLPGNESVHVNLANALFQRGRPGEAIAEYQAALQLDPSDVDVQNNLAWLLATAPPPSLRNGREAVRLSRLANESSGGKNPVILHTLAAALAESGEFDEAVKYAQQAVDLARAAGQEEMASQAARELERYKARQALQQGGK